MQTGLPFSEKAHSENTSSGYVQFGQVVGDRHGFEAHRDYPEQQFQWVFWIVHSLDGVVVGVVDDPTSLVGLDALTFDYPIDGWSAVDHVIVGRHGDILYGGAVVINDGGEVVDGFAVLLFPGVFHLLHPIMSGFGGRVLQGSGVHVHGFIAEVQIGQITPGPAESPKACGSLYRRDAGEFLGEVIGVAGAVVLGMQEAVDVVEEVVLGMVSPG